MKSKKPRIQRKRLYTASKHRRRKMVSAALTPDLKAKYGIRSMPLRKEDEVVVITGSFSGLEGKVEKIDTQNYRIHVAGASVEKADGTTIFYPIHPSNVMIGKLKLDDKRRKEVIKRKTGAAEVD
ncbi:MAG: 50S ribosomal protein L24 [Candidatus Jordarchaeum sp.]|uniref:50S ribosomal protein L24 n=1 Tax=Candidatus Jordarchaeum sp. TaxID=2823881 RepID=UPI0040499193